MLPLSVLIPTRNCAAMVPAHLAAMTSWVDLAQEVVIVDSQSNDGTVDQLVAGLRHARPRILSHPPGLYQSWNFGIQHLRAPYAYISTVGETIERSGLEHLHRLAEERRCDVVISKPRFVDEQDRPFPPSRWPIDTILEELHVADHQVLSGLLLFAFALVHCNQAILGSSASNLYATAALKQHPFPTNFGTVGDGAWGIQNALNVRLGVTRRVCSTFLEHPKTYSLDEYRVNDLTERLFAETHSTWERTSAADPELRRRADDIQLPAIFHWVERRIRYQRRLEESRHGGLPWIFKPSAWLARWRRGECHRRLRQLTRGAVQTLSDRYSAR